MGISDDFLMWAALGKSCFVIDFSNKESGKSRALWQGLEWIKYCLNRRWFDNDGYVPVGRGKKCIPYFHEQYERLSKRVKNRLDYFKPFTRGYLCIYGWSNHTDMDGRTEDYRDILWHHVGVEYPKLINELWIDQ